MTSTIANLCLQLKQKPTQITHFTKILQLLVSKNIPLSEKLASNSAISQIIKAYLDKLDRKGQ